jgi:hypothetical protein
VSESTLVWIAIGLIFLYLVVSGLEKAGRRWVMTFTPDELDFPDGTVYQSYAISGDWIVSTTPTITIPDPPLDSAVMWWTPIFHNADHSQSAIGCAAGASVY